MAQVPAIFRQTGDSVDHVPSGDMTAGDVAILGTNLVGIAKSDIPADTLGALSIVGMYEGPKVTGAISAWAALYWDEDGDPLGGTAGSGALTTNSALGPFAGWADGNGAAELAETVTFALRSMHSVSSLPRASLGQDDLAPYAIPLSAYKVWDAPFTNVVATTGANDDLALVYGTFGTAASGLETGDLKNVAGPTTRKVGFQFPVPVEYVAGETITLRINCGAKTTVASTTLNVDAEVTRDAAPSVDICATAAQSCNSLTAANKDFTLTPTNVVPGDLLNVVISMIVADTATATAVIGRINKVEMLMDVKG
jgi:predicted RecA/RadA family phage recombinase